ncbi:1892_t:CDS:2, partial [Paraglomus brasilianum]
MSTWFSPSRPSTTNNATTTNNCNSQTSQVPSTISTQVNKQQTSYAKINNNKHKSNVCSLADNLNHEQFHTLSTYSNVLKSANSVETTESMFPNFLTSYMARPRFVDVHNRNKNPSVFSDSTNTAVVCDPEERTTNCFKRELVTSVERPFTTLSKKLDRIVGLLERIDVKVNDCKSCKSGSNADVGAKRQLCTMMYKPNADMTKEQLKDILQDDIMADVVVKLQECLEKIASGHYQKLYREIVAIKNAPLQEIITESTKNRHLLETLLEKLQSTNFQATICEKVSEQSVFSQYVRQRKVKDELLECTMPLAAAHNNVSTTDIYSNNIDCLMEATEANTNLTRDAARRCSISQALPLLDEIDHNKSKIKRLKRKLVFDDESLRTTMP